MYKNLGYIVYRTVIDYYAGPGDVDEDAYGMNKAKMFNFWLILIVGGVIHSFEIVDMRKAMPRDVDKKSMIPLKHPVHCDEVE